MSEADVMASFGEKAYLLLKIDRGFGGFGGMAGGELGGQGQ